MIWLRNIFFTFLGLLSSAILLSLCYSQIVIPIKVSHYLGAACNIYSYVANSAQPTIKEENAIGIQLGKAARLDPRYLDIMKDPYLSYRFKVIKNLSPQELLIDFQASARMYSFCAGDRVKE